MYLIIFEDFSFSSASDEEMSVGFIDDVIKAEDGCVKGVINTSTDPYTYLKDDGTWENIKKLSDEKEIEKLEKEYEKACEESKKLTKELKRIEKYKELDRLEKRSEIDCATASGYLGLFSILGIFAPFALIFGILGVIDINKHENKHGMGRCIFGITMGGLFTLIFIQFLLGQY